MKKYTLIAVLSIVAIFIAINFSKQVKLKYYSKEIPLGSETFRYSDSSYDSAMRLIVHGYIGKGRKLLLYEEKLQKKNRTITPVHQLIERIKIRYERLGFIFRDLNFGDLVGDKDGSVIIISMTQGRFGLIPLALITSNQYIGKMRLTQEAYVRNIVDHMHIVRILKNKRR
ncbi:MAG: hypothetical protein R3B45_08455 [Bdellovibrionota bacterium]